jgi:hypothetical protein
MYKSKEGMLGGSSTELVYISCEGFNDKVTRALKEKEQPAEIK